MAQARCDGSFVQVQVSGQHSCGKGEVATCTVGQGGAWLTGEDDHSPTHEARGNDAVIPSI